MIYHGTLLCCSNRDSAMFDNVTDSKEDLKKTGTSLWMIEHDTTIIFDYAKYSCWTLLWLATWALLIAKIVLCFKKNTLILYLK